MALIPTCCLPSTRTSCPGPCPFTSADGEYTRRYSNGSRKRAPSSNATSSTRERVRSLISLGVCIVKREAYTSATRRRGKTGVLNRGDMQPTDTSQPDYFHKVVDCQWACPAHTDVPEYIRLIAQGRFTDAYMVNRHSNVFPGILGRTCDRPCEPACRRGRVEEKPVAICRLKRVAADHRGDISDLLPKAPAVKNGKRVALVGAGPSSLTVANDLLPLGYDVTIFERNAQPGGLMRVNIPAFRLPATVLDEECGYIIDMGANMQYGTTVESLKTLLDDGYDAVYVGSGAPKGKELDLPGRWDAPSQVHIGIEWLANVHFGHFEKIDPRVIIIGVGNTAMDCCRTAKRFGATDVKVIARRGRKHFKASPWELEDAEEEQVEIIENHAPKRFVIENGKLVGMEFERLHW